MEQIFIFGNHLQIHFIKLLEEELPTIQRLTKHIGSMTQSARIPIINLSERLVVYG